MRVGRLERLFGNFDKHEPTPPSWQSEGRAEGGVVSLVTIITVIIICASYETTQWKKQTNERERDRDR